MTLVIVSTPITGRFSRRSDWVVRSERARPVSDAFEGTPVKIVWPNILLVDPDVK
jgi:hypothetical protein